MKLLLVLGTTFLGAGMMFQAPATPPVKMGLWEITSVAKMSGMNMPAGMAMPNMTTKVRACYTPESYAKNLAAGQRQQNCTLTNETWTAKSYSVDMTCKNNAVGHVEMTFDSKEESHGVVHISMNAGGHPMDIDSTIQSHFVSSDCGSVTPDKPVISR